VKYDDWSNAKGKNKGVQKRSLNINPRVYYTPFDYYKIWTIHALKLSFWDFLQQIYSLLSIL